MRILKIRPLISQCININLTLINLQNVIQIVSFLSKIFTILFIKAIKLLERQHTEMTREKCDETSKWSGRTKWFNTTL